MRKRTGAFHAESYEEYLQKVKDHDKEAGGAAPHVSPFNYLAPMNRPFRTANDYEPTLDLMQAVAQLPSGRPGKYVLNGNSPKMQSEDNLDSTDSDDNLSPTVIPSDNQFSSLEEERSPQPVESLIVKAMVIGTQEVSRHSLVNSLVPGESEGCSDLKSALDLVVKIQNEQNRNIKYHFWIKDCSGKEADRFKSIYSTYYKNVSSFIFVYSVYHRESFNSLRSSIEEVKRTISKEFKGILIGLVNQDSELEREVDFSEGEDIRLREGLSEFIETDLANNVCKQTILGFITGVAESHQVKLKQKNQ